MPARLWRWRPVAACGNLRRTSPASIPKSLQSRSWEPMGLEASARRPQGLAPGLAGLLKELKTRRLYQLSNTLDARRGWRIQAWQLHIKP